MDGLRGTVDSYTNFHRFQRAAQPSETRCLAVNSLRICDHLRNLWTAPPHRSPGIDGEKPILRAGQIETYDGHPRPSLAGVFHTDGQDGRTRMSVRQITSFLPAKNITLEVGDGGCVWGPLPGRSKCVSHSGDCPERIQAVQICEICVPIHSGASFSRAETCTRIAQIGTDSRGLATAVATREEGASRCAVRWEETRKYSGELWRRSPRIHPSDRSQIAVSSSDLGNDVALRLTSRDRGEPLASRRDHHDPTITWQGLIDGRLHRFDDGQSNLAVSCFCERQLS